MKIVKKVFSNEIEEENKKLKEESKSLVKAKEEHLKNLREIKIKKARYKKELYVIKNELLVHYHSLLNVGNDTRSEGLTWIVKAIWSLGFKVFMTYLPKYLDEEGIIYLFNVKGELIVVLEKGLRIEEIVGQNSRIKGKNKNWSNRTDIQNIS